LYMQFSFKEGPCPPPTAACYMMQDHLSFIGQGLLHVFASTCMASCKTAGILMQLVSLLEQQPAQEPGRFHDDLRDGGQCHEGGGVEFSGSMLFAGKFITR